MQIDEAIVYVRGFAEAMRSIGQRYAEENKKSIAAEVAFQDAEACETVLDALEAFLKKQEEDNSYHTKG